MGVVSSGSGSAGRGRAGVPARWWLVLWVLLTGLWVSGETDPVMGDEPD